jgi:hypothetical protein
MGVRGPEFPARPLVWEAGRGDVIGERIDPDIHDVPGVAGNRHAPIERRAADREIGETPFDEGDDFVAVLLGRHEFRVGFVMGEEAVGVGRELEEIALLFDPLHGRAAGRELAVGPVCKLVLVEIGLLAHRIPAFVFR